MSFVLTGLVLRKQHCRRWFEVGIEGTNVNFGDSDGGIPVWKVCKRIVATRLCVGVKMTLLTFGYPDAVTVGGKNFLRIHFGSVTFAVFGDCWSRALGVVHDNGVIIQ